MAMARRRLKRHFRIPSYVTPRNRWRQLIWRAARAAAQDSGVEYCPADHLAIVLYMGNAALARHNVDNRTKDILDALQGRMGGAKSIRNARLCRKGCTMAPFANDGTAGSDLGRGRRSRRRLAGLKAMKLMLLFDKRDRQ